MSLMDMIESHVTPGMLQQIGSRVGLTPEQMQGAMASLAPMLGGGIAQHGTAGSLPTPPADAEPGSDAATDHGNDVLGTIFGSKQASRDAAASASAETGIGIDRIKAVLPQLAGVAAAAFLAHKVSQSGGFGSGQQ